VTTTTPLLVIGAGPYALSAAALAREHGIDTMVVGRPMGFWRRHMPAGMLLRSGPDWHLDASGVHTLEAYLEERAIDPADVDPLPLGLFLDYAEWFRQAKGIEVLEDRVVDLAKPGDRFEAVLDGGARIAADAVVAAPGIRHFANVPAWAGSVPAGRAAHTCDLVRFDRVSWSFVDPYLESTMRVRGWWRSLPEAEQDTITKRFWEVGRLTLEYWLTPRLASQAIHRWPGTEVVQAEPTGADGELRVRLSSGDDLSVDQVVFASGYRADLARVPYLGGVLDRIEVTDGFPVLDEAFGASLSRLYLPGFVATRDFGPFFGFVKGTSAAAGLIVGDLLARP
jgi:cation diffusion facilitator CzcD-associated flavoprotein CzcO